MTKEKPLKREYEEKLLFRHIDNWSLLKINAVYDQLSKFNISGVDQRAYRSVNFDTPDRLLRQANIELRARATIEFPSSVLMNSDPDDREVIRTERELCLKSGPDILDRIEIEVKYTSCASRARRKLDRQSQGFIKEAFSRLNIAASELVPVASADVERAAYFQLMMFVSPDGDVSSNHAKHARRIILAICMDHGQAIIEHNHKMIEIGKIPTQIEIENHAGHCKYESPEGFLSDQNATKRQIDSAIAFAKNNISQALGNVWDQHEVGEISKLGEAEKITSAWLKRRDLSVTPFSMPRLQRVA